MASSHESGPDAPRSGVRDRRPGTRIAALLCLISTGFVSGCGVQIPSDPSGTLEDVAGGTIRVGYSPEPGLIEAADATPSGPVVKIVEKVAQDLGASVDWTLHSEESIVTLLEEDALDLGVGGFTDQTPWVDRVAVSRGYDELPGVQGHTLVVLTQLGENAFLSRVEETLDEVSAP